MGLVAQGKVFSTGIEGLFEDSDLLVDPETSDKDDKGEAEKPAKVPKCACLHGIVCCRHSSHSSRRAATGFQVERNPLLDTLIFDTIVSVRVNKVSCMILRNI